jgi:hypothetical protein
VLQRQRGKVRVRNEISSRLSRKEHFSKDLPMLFRGMHDPNARLIQPTLNAAGGFF